jgi:hypothetical protein
MAATPAPPSLEQSILGGANPWPFALALGAMGVVMLAFPRAAVPLGVLLVLGALLVDRKALADFQAWEKGVSP